MSIRFKTSSMFFEALDFASGLPSVCRHVLRAVVDVLRTVLSLAASVDGVNSERYHCMRSTACDIFLSVIYWLLRFVRCRPDNTFSICVIVQLTIVLWRFG